MKRSVSDSWLMSMLVEFLEGGGRVLILSGTTEGDELTNLNAVMEYYGISVLEGVMIEESTDHYVFNTTVLLMPDMESSDITDPLIDDNYHVILPCGESPGCIRAERRCDCDASADVFGRIFPQGRRL